MNIFPIILCRGFVYLYNMYSVWNWLRQMFDFLAPWMKKRSGTLLFLGLDNAGKTCLLHRLVTDRMAQPVPTPLPHSEELRFGNKTFTTYDLGGHEQVRRVWRNYFPAADGIVFIMDGANRERFAEAHSELKGLLEDEEISQLPVAILVNKIDLPDAASEHEVITLFGLYNCTTGKETISRRGLEGRRPLEVFPVSVLQRQGYGSALRWLANYVD